MKQPAVLKLTNLLTASLVIILVLVPFQAFLTVWAASLFSHYTAWRLWDETLLVIGIALAIALSCYHNIWKNIWRLHIFWLILSYALLQLAIGLVAYIKHDVTAKALGYGLIVNLRFLAFFGVCLVVASQTIWLKRHWQQLLLIPAAVVVGFGLLQYFVLPYDFLQHFGYSLATIPPYETINHNLHYVRIMSTLRGANPLGAYLVIVICAVTTLLLKAKTNRLRVIYGLFAAGTIITLFFSYSRSALIGTALGILIITWLSIENPKLRRWLSIGLATLIIIAAFTALGLRNNVRFENIFTHTQQHSAIKATSDQSHISALKSGLRDALHQPLGRGPGTAGPASVYNNNSPRIAENYFVQIAQEVGWLGLIIFLLIMWLITKGLWLERKNPLALTLLAAFVGLTFVNLLSHAWADDTLAYVWWGLAGIALAPSFKSKSE